MCSVPYFKQFETTYSLNDSSCLLNFIKDNVSSNSFRVLKLTPSTSFDTALTFITSDEFAEAVNSTSNWFVTTVFVQDRVEPERLEFTLKIEESRPFIILWYGARETVVSFKNPFTNVFTCCDLNSIEKVEDEDKIVEMLSECNTVKFKFHLQVFLTKTNEGADILTPDIDINKEFDGWRLIDYAARDNDILSLRFLLLLAPWNLTKVDEEGRSVVQIAIEYGKRETLRALFNLPLNKENSWPLDDDNLQEIREVMIFKNDLGDTPLLISVKCGNREATNFFLKYGADVNQKNRANQTAVDIAWERRQLDIVNDLLEADSLFPTTFCSEDNVKLDKIIRGTENERDKFHSDVRTGDKISVAKFIKDHPRLTKAYSTLNSSAVHTSFTSKQFEVYALLMDSGFSPGPHEEIAEDALSDSEKEELKRAKAKYFTGLDKAHINILVSKSRVGLGQRDRTLLIQRYFEALDSIEIISKVLKVVQHSESLDIIFDFCGTSIKDLDPTMEDTTTGLCDFRTGRVYIAAGQETNAILGTLAHELTHLAMDIRFGNECNPYEPRDITAKESFQKIVNDLKDTKLREDIINRLFTAYKNPSSWPSELIVRVPHLIAYYKDDEKKLESIKEYKEVKSLFEFYTQSTQVELQQFIKNPSEFRGKKRIRHLNDLLEGLRDVQASRFRLTENSWESYPEGESFIVETNIPSLAKLELYQMLLRYQVDVDNNFIFFNLEKLNEKLTEDIHNAWKLWTGLTLVIQCRHDSFEENILSMVADLAKELRIIALMRSGSKLQEKLGKSLKRTLTRNYTWSQLDKDSQCLLLEKQVKFQGYDILLGDIIGQDIQNEEVLPLATIFEEEGPEVCSAFQQVALHCESHFVNRTLMSDDNGKVSKLEDFLPDGMNYQKVIILSDSAKSGKTTFLRHVARTIKEKNKRLLVVQVRQMVHTEEFDKCNSSSCLDFSKEKLLQATGPLESLLLNNYPQKVVLMIDDLHNVGSSYKTALSCLASLSKTNFCQIWIATRPRIKEELKSSLGISTYKLQELNREDISTILINAWSKKLIPGHFEPEKLCDFVSHFLQTINLDPSMAKSPPQVASLADIHEETMKTYMLHENDLSLLPKLDLLHIIKNCLPKQMQPDIQVTEEPNELTQFLVQCINTIGGTVDMRHWRRHFNFQSYCPDEKHSYLEYKTKTTRRPVQFEEFCAVGMVVKELNKSYPSLLKKLFSILKDIDTGSNQNLTGGIIKYFLSKEDKMEEQTVRYANLILYHYHKTCPEETTSTACVNTQQREEKISYKLKDLVLGPLAVTTIKETWCLAGVKGNIIMLTMAWSNGKRIGLNLKNDLLNRVNENKRTVWIEAAIKGNSETMDWLWNAAKKELSTDEMVHDVLLSASEGTTAWLASAELGNVQICDKLWVWACELGLNPLADLLLTTDKNGRTAWHIASLNGYDPLLQALWSWARSLMTPDNLKNDFFLLRETSCNDSVWSCARGRLSTSEILWGFGKQILTENECKEMLLSKDSFQMCAWHYSAEKNDVESLKRLFTWAQDMGENLTMNILCGCDSNGNTIWHIAAMNSSEDVLEYLLGVGVAPELLSQMLSSTNDFSRSSWSIILEHCTVKILDLVSSHVVGASAEHLLNIDGRENLAVCNAGEGGVFASLLNRAKREQLNIADILQTINKQGEDNI